MICDNTGNRNPQLDSSIDPTKYKVLCSNGSTIDSTLNVDDDCALAVGVQGEVLMLIINESSHFFPVRLTGLSNKSFMLQ